MKKCYYSENNGPLLADLGFLARAGATAICVVLPLVLALLSGRLVDDFDVRQIEMDARFNEGVLVVHSSSAPNLEVLIFYCSPVLIFLRFSDSRGLANFTIFPPLHSPLPISPTVWK